MDWWKGWKGVSPPVYILLGSLSGLVLIKLVAAARSTRQKPRRSRPTRSRATSPHHERQSSTAPPEDAGEGAEESDAGETHRLLTLLYNIGESQARKDGFVHRSITCNHCGTTPIRGHRFKCANCVDFDLCEQCEALQVHQRTHVFLKIRTPIPPLANPRSALVPPLYPGLPLASRALDWEQLRELQARTHFDHIELDAFWDEFESLSTVNVESGQGGITRETFDKCLGPLGLESNLIVDRLFRFFDRDHDQVISFDEMVTGLGVICKGSFDERIHHAFEGYDLNGDGAITEDELSLMFNAYFRLSMELVRDVVKAMEEGMMDQFDDQAAKPVSAAFSVPIPAAPADWAAPPAKEAPARTPSPQSPQRPGSSSLAAGRTGRSAPPRSAGAPSSAAPSTRRSPRLPPLVGASDANPTVRINTGLRAAPSGLASAASEAPVSAGPILGPTLPLSPVALHGNAASLLSPGAASSLVSPTATGYPVLESISHEAIREMIDNVFQLAPDAARSTRRLSLADFRLVVEKDPSLLSWFEALGSVF